MKRKSNRMQYSNTIKSSRSRVHIWHAVIGETTIADGIIDRLVENAQRLELKGKSLRRKKLEKKGKILTADLA